MLAEDTEGFLEVSTVLSLRFLFLELVKGLARKRRLVHTAPNHVPLPIRSDPKLGRYHSNSGYFHLLAKRICDALA